jgi:hypothetical protein
VSFGSLPFFIVTFSGLETYKQHHSPLTSFNMDDADDIVDEIMEFIHDKIDRLSGDDYAAVLGSVSHMTSDECDAFEQTRTDR